MHTETAKSQKTLRRRSRRHHVRAGSGRRKPWILRGVLTGVAALGLGVVAVNAASGSSGSGAEVSSAELVADGDGTPSRTIVYAGVGDNGCSAAGAVDFKDNGDVFTVHDYCEDGYGLLAFFCPGDCASHEVPAIDFIENTNGFDGAPVSRSVDIKEGITYEVEFHAVDGSTIINTNQGKVIE